MLREACASGDVRSQQLVCERFGWMPEPINPSEWLRDQMDLKWSKREDVIRELYQGLEDDSDAAIEGERFVINVSELPDHIQEAYETMCDTGQDLLAARKEIMRLFGVYVNKDDYDRWLAKLKPETEPATAGGKQSRITRLLAEMFPTGVPSRDDCPRQPLTAELIKRDASLSPLDPKTLRTAIEAYNRQPGNAGKR
jgi:hypothetical protein